MSACCSPASSAHGWHRPSGHPRSCALRQAGPEIELLQCPVLSPNPYSDLARGCQGGKDRFCGLVLRGVYCPRMSIRFEKIWVQQCKATKGIKRRFGVKSALDYLIREKLLNFADAAEQRPEFARELPRFLAEVWRIFNQYEIAGYVASLKPIQGRDCAACSILRCPTHGQAPARVVSGDGLTAPGPEYAQ